MIRNERLGCEGGFSYVRDICLSKLLDVEHLIGIRSTSASFLYARESHRKVSRLSRMFSGSETHSLLRLRIEAIQSYGVFRFFWCYLVSVRLLLLLQPFLPLHAIHVSFFSRTTQRSKLLFLCMGLPAMRAQI
jgi:hypothetical protein